MPELPFAKGQALGNDYLVLDAADLPWPLEPHRIRMLCDRHLGIGSDGILLGFLEERPIRLRIYNPDGSEAEKSGNGLRIFAAYLHGRGIVRDEPFAVALPKDTVEMRVEATLPDGQLMIAVDIGTPSFLGAAVGFVPEPGEALGVELDLGEAGAARVNPVSLGNPHCVVFVDELDRADFLRRAPALATHPAFAAGTNVQFARVAGPDRLEAWIWERGVGETLASGSSASAVAAAARRLGLVAARDLVVDMPGGRVQVQAGEGEALRLRGPAEIVYRGRLAEAVAQRLG
ncbi:MAG TPA: diaminopimelate epimerase [Longimicrobiales bacterium]